VRAPALYVLDGSTPIGVDVGFKRPALRWLHPLWNARPDFWVRLIVRPLGEYDGRGLLFKVVRASLDGRYQLFRRHGDQHELHADNWRYGHFYRKLKCCYQLH